MLKFVVVLFLIAIVAAVLGFGGITVGAAEIVQVIFFLFLVLLTVTLIVGMVRK